MLTEKERATNFDTMRHIERVRNLVNKKAVQLLERGELHDQTKLVSPEVELFAEYTDQLAGLTYGSPEYDECRKKLAPALEHHYARNRHHPEHHAEVSSPKLDRLRADINYLEDDDDDQYIPDNVRRRLKDHLEAYEASLRSSINNMNLVDLVEMLCDWKAASERHNDGNINKSIETNCKRFGLSPQLANIFYNTVETL